MVEETSDIVEPLVEKELKSVKNFVVLNEVDVYDNSRNYKGYAFNCSNGKVGTVIGIYKTPKRTAFCERYGFDYKNCVDIYFKPSSASGFSVNPSKVFLTQLPLSCLSFTKKSVIVENSRGYFRERIYQYIDYKTRSLKEPYSAVVFIFSNHEKQLILEKEGESKMKDLYHDLLINATNVVTTYDKVMKKGVEK